MVRDSQHSVLKDVRFIKLMTTVSVTVPHASVASSKPKIVLDLHSDTCIVDGNCLLIHDKPVNFLSYNPKDNKHTRTVDAAVCYDSPCLLCPMQCCLNGM